VARIASYRNDYGMPNLSKNRQDPLLLSLGGAIKRIRLAKNLTQEKLAFLSSVDRTYMGQVERGDNNVAILTLSKIANALGVTVEELIKEARF
jgi:transcriptional regulator with XRE-family HTH domain